MTWMGRVMVCLDTGEVFYSLKELIERYPKAKKAPRTADGKQKTSGGLTWAWGVFRTPLSR